MAEFSIDDIFVFESFSWKLYASILIAISIASFILFPGKMKKFLQYVTHPLEFVALVRYLLFWSRSKMPQNLTEEEEFCFFTLTKVSRSFSAVILELTPELRDPVCIFYLVLRGLDTIEDDMSIPVDKKIQELKSFASHLDEPGWNSRKGYGAQNKYEKELLENFDKVISVYSQLKTGYREAIKDSTIRMANGMCEFLEDRPNSISDYERYCHYVAGLVGIGLSKLFHYSGLEGDRFKDLDFLSNSMGLFLQKTNITRDYLEDILQEPPRVFYPKEIWSKYVANIEDMKKPEYKEQALQCLNHMITDAVRHINDCVDYMQLVHEPSVFRFCAIPQVMAIATLERCYNNYEVFKKEVKIRKGEAVQLIMNSTDFSKVLNIFLYYMDKLEKKIPKADPNAEKLHQSLNFSRKKIHSMQQKNH